MSGIIDLIEKYRHEADVHKRLDIATEIYGKILDDLRLFIFGKVKASEAEDVLQELLIAIFTSLPTFRGNTDKEFLGWCYRIARNKANDHHRDQFSDRLEPFPSDELWKLIEDSSQYDRDWKLERSDIREALKLLDEAKPECRFFLWRHFVLDLDYSEIGDELHLKYDAVRMRVVRCLETLQGLI